MPDLFHNPYHFVPLPEQPGGPERTPLPTEDRPLPPHVTHSCCEEDTFSGRLRCQLTTITPLVIGGEQTGTAPKQVQPFLVPGTTEPGIPGSTIRGMISSVYEVITRSALRVFTDRIFSYRKSMTEGLSALGLIVKSEHGLSLYPLADPHLESNHTDAFDLRGALPKGSGDYRVMFRDSLRKVYFGTWSRIREQDFLCRLHTNSVPTGGPFYALPQAAIESKQKSQSTARGTIYFDLGDATDLEPEPWDDHKHNETTHYRGILRVLGVSSSTREKGMPTKKHEFFIPLPKVEEQSLRDGTAVVFPILPEAIQRFEQLADERTDEADKDTDAADLLPFTPHGQNRGSGEAPSPGRPRRAYSLKPGDIVFFRPTADGKAVAEVSLSSIWRGRVEKVENGVRAAATLSDFIAVVDPDLLPMGDPRKTRLTPAELLFGFTEHSGSRALAGRVQFSTARPTPGQPPGLHPDWIDLQVLNGPKPPCPNFYFRGRRGQKWLAKSKLSLADDRIQGRKFYLHAQQATRANGPDGRGWTMDPKNAASGEYDRMRVRVRPVLADRTFEFEVRFDNVSRFEMGAILYALRPSTAFHHKLGLGRPLGLGTVRLDPLVIERLDRRRRYALDPLRAARFHHSWQYQVAAGTWSGPNEPAIGNPEMWVAHFLEELRRYDPSETTLRALLTLGDPAKVTHPVHYPQVAGIASNDPAFEADRYEWFVTNDHKNTADADRQHLGAVGETLPTLHRLPKTERRDRARPRFSPGRPSSPRAGGAAWDEAQNRSGPRGWLGPVLCTCTGRGQQGDWKFEFADDAGLHWGFLDRDAEPPPNLKPGQRLSMHYKTASQGRCFFKPA